MMSLARQSSFAALLAPWLDHARRHTSGYLDDLAEPTDLDEDLWMDWDLNVPEDASAAVWTLALETMELLDLMVRADYAAGWALICEILDLSLYVGLLEELLPQKIYPKHTISWTDLGRDGAASFELAKQLVSGVPDTLHTPGFRRAKAALVELCRPSERDQAADRIRVCIKLYLLEPNALGDLQRLCTLATLAQDPMRLDLLQAIRQTGPGRTETHTVPSDEPQGARCDVFYFERVTINTSRVVLTDQMLATMRAIEQCGVHITALTIGRSSHAPNEMSPQATTKFFRALVPNSATTLMALSIGHDMDQSVFQSVCSSLLVTQKVNDVTFKAHNRLDKYWSWIAYSIFSSEASTRVQYLHLDVLHFSLQDVEEIQRVLGARDPLSTIAPSSLTPDEAVSRLSRDREVIDVRPNTAALVRTGNAEAELSVVLIDECSRIGLRIVDDSISRSHICVLYPGAGLCWIRRDDVVARRILPTHASPLRAKPLERISLELGNDTPLAALLALIRLIGPLTRILLLYSPHSVVLPDRFLRDVLDVCPNLVRLDLVKITIASFTWFLDNKAAAQLSQLSLTRVHCLDADGYAQLVVALRDSSKGVGRSLLELAIRHHSRLLCPLWPSLMDTLSTNYRLQRLIIRAESAERTDALVELASQLHGHHGDALHGRHKSLPLRSRLAFLSVLASDSCLLPELGAAMLSIVFTFAAPNKRRVCGLVIWTRERALA